MEFSGQLSVDRFWNYSLPCLTESCSFGFGSKDPSAQVETQLSMINENDGVSSGARDEDP